MARAMTIEQYLDSHHIPYDVVRHSRTPTSLKTAQAAEIEPDCLAKGILLEDDRGYMMAVLPATHHLILKKLRQDVGRNLRMATETEIGRVFKDCDLGAIPPIGPAYGVETVLDDSLAGHGDLYLEAGDHERLIHMRTEDFMGLMPDARHGRFTTPD